METFLFEHIVPHLKVRGMDAAEITRARERWQSAGENDARGLPCPFCSGRGRTGWAQSGFTQRDGEATEILKCKSCGETIQVSKR